MRVTVKTGILFALLFILVKMLCFWSGLFIEDLRPLIMINILFILLSIAIGLYLKKRKQTEETNLLSDIKDGMSAGIPYAILVSAFLYFFYAKINPEFNEHHAAEYVMNIKKNIEDPENLERMRSGNADYEMLSKEEILAKENEKAKTLYTAGNTTTVSLLSMVLLTTLYSILIAIVYKRLLFRR